MPSRVLTIKEFARDYYMKVNFVDIHGRNIGYDYSYIFAKVKARFPNSRTSRDWVRKMASELNAYEKLPIRGRLSKVTAQAYAMTLLLRRSGKYAHKSIAKSVKKNFPTRPVNLATLRSLDQRLRNLGFTVPPRE
jgi:hypothetical protein